MNNSLLARFLPEARDLLQVSATGLLKIEKNPSDRATINEVFRAVHTLKGSSGLFDILPLTKLVHAAEDLLDEARSEKVTLDSDLVDVLLDSLDQAGAWLDSLEKQEKLPDDSSTIANQLATTLRDRIEGKESEAPSAIQDVEADTGSGASWLVELPEKDRLEAFSAVGADAELIAILYEPSEGCFFTGLDPLALALQTPELLGVSIERRDEWPSLSEFDPYRCNLKFKILTAAKRDAIEHHFRYVRDELTLSTVSPVDLVSITGELSDQPVIADFFDEARKLIADDDFEGLRTAAAAITRLVAGTLRVASSARWIEQAALKGRQHQRILTALVDSIANGSFEAPRSNAGVMEDSARLVAVRREISPLARRILAAQRRVLNINNQSDAAIPSVASIIRNVVRKYGSPSDLDKFGIAEQTAAELGAPLPLLGFLAEFEHGASAGEEERLPGIEASAVHTLKAPFTPIEGVTEASDELLVSGRGTSTILKVNQEKIDYLMNLIGELIVSKNSLPFLAKRAEEIYGSREMSREIKDKYAVVDRLAQEMQNAIMQVRMLPMSEVFDRMPRLVRDLSRKLGKQVDLVIEGQDTAADKTIVDALGDPLVHILRNSVDHGIELPDVRKALGKPAIARIVLQAAREADDVIVTVVDDGKGICPEKIRESAVRNGVVGEQDALRLSDQEAINLVFHPGFSTASEVSEVSGRGVGMDAVLTGVQRLGGRVSVTSQVGRGTQVRLSLPLSMAVTRIMVVEAGDSLYGVPMDVVVETVRIPASQVHKIKASETFVLRDRIIPLVRMSSLLHFTPMQRSDGSDEAVLVCECDGNQFGLVIDRFREGMDVVLKPLEGILAGCKGFAGTTLLGDGRVLLVLDLKELI